MGADLFITGGKSQFAGLNIAIHCSIILLVKVSCRQGRNLGSDDNSALGSELLVYTEKERSRAFGMKFENRNIEFLNLIINCDAVW